MSDIHERSAADLPWRDDVTAVDLPPTLLRETTSTEQVPSRYPLGWTHRPHDDVQESWLNQITVIPADAGPIRIQARRSTDAFAAVRGDQCDGRPEQRWPWTAPLLIIGAVRGPSVIYPDEAAAAQAELIRQLEMFGVAAVPARTVDRHHRWTEPSVIAFPPSGDSSAASAEATETALGIARQMGIDTVVQVDDGEWRVLTLGTNPAFGYALTATAPASVNRDVEHRCPMQAAPGEHEYCDMRGGPWTSSSMRAAAAWQEHRDQLITALGCQTCEGQRYQLSGTVHASGGPIPTVPIPLATRWLEPDETRVED